MRDRPASVVVEAFEILCPLGNHSYKWIVSTIEFSWLRVFSFRLHEVARQKRWKTYTTPVAESKWCSTNLFDLNLFQSLQVAPEDERKMDVWSKRCSETRSTLVSTHGRTSWRTLLFTCNGACANLSALPVRASLSVCMHIFPDI